jgi:tetratricopeptide (TPR) repeat protein
MRLRTRGVFQREQGRVSHIHLRRRSALRFLDQNRCRALGLKPELAEAHNNLGYALRQEGSLEPAVPHYEQALRLKPDWPEVHNNLAIALQEQGRMKEAVGHYERALLLNPGPAEVQQNLGGALAQSGRTVEAIAALKRALALKPDYAVSAACSQKTRTAFMRFRSDGSIRNAPQSIAAEISGEVAPHGVDMIGTVHKPSTTFTS